jgi:Skp family chaperone for outer membrane proteins
MKRFALVAVSLFFAAFLTISAQAQTTPTGGDKIGLIAWGAFEDPAKGIKKYVAGLNQLEVEFKPVNDDLRAMGTKWEALGKEIQDLQKLVSENKPVPIPPAEIQKKVDAYGQMERDIKKKQEDAKAAYQSRFNVVIGPIQDDIIKALNDYATAKGYAVILDGARLQESGILLGFSQKANVTEDFIVFYNARPATAAVTTPR